jgi:hypothetical protein
MHITQKHEAAQKRRPKHTYSVHRVGRTWSAGGMLSRRAAKHKQAGPAQMSSTPPAKESMLVRKVSGKTSPTGPKHTPPAADTASPHALLHESIALRPGTCLQRC